MTGIVLMKWQVSPAAAFVSNVVFNDAHAHFKAWNQCIRRYSQSASSTPMPMVVCFQL
jgi:hypothetical protein